MQQIRNIEDFNLNPTFTYVAKKQPPIKKNSKKILFFITFAILLIISLSLYGWISGTLSEISLFSIFSLQRITVYGVQGTNADLIKQSLSVFSGKNLLTLSSDQINENISKFGFVEGFLLRKTYPSEITVEIKLKPSQGCVKRQGIFYELDGAGSFWESSKIPDSFFEVDSSVDISDINFQKIVKDIKEINCANVIVLISRKSVDSYLIKTKDNVKLIVSGEDFKTEWEKFIQSKSFIKKNFGDGGTLDLRWSNRVVLSPEEKTIPTEEEKING